MTQCHDSYGDWTPAAPVDDAEEIAERAKKNHEIWRRSGQCHDQYDVASPAPALRSPVEEPATA